MSTVPIKKTKMEVADWSLRRKVVKPIKFPRSLVRSVMTYPPPLLPYSCISGNPRFPLTLTHPHAPQEVATTVSSSPLLEWYNASLSYLLDLYEFRSLLVNVACPSLATNNFGTDNRE